MLQEETLGLDDPVSAAAQSIRRLSAMVGAAIDRSQLFLNISREFKSAFHYDRFSIYLYDANREFLNAFANADGAIVERFSNTRIAQDTVAWHAIQSRKPIVVSDLASTGWNGATSLASVGLNVSIAFPLILGDKVIGTLHVSFVEQPDNIAAIQTFLLELCPVLTMLLFVVLSDEREFRSEVMQKGSMYSPPEQGDESILQLESRLLETGDMAPVMSLARKVAKLHIPVLITGETGTGKSMMARWLHRHSPRRSAPFIKVNCPSLAPTLFESEMFGYAKGAFTGAHAKRIGRIEMAQNGTLFLDEIGELSPDMQSKLLQVMEESCFERVGEAQSISVDIRVVSATNIDLKDALDNGRLRRDLFYRLAPVVLRLPPLRQRKNDIAIMVEYFTKVFSRQWDLRPPNLSRRVLNSLYDHDWPGNIRELRNVVSRMLLHSLDGTVTDAFVRKALHEWKELTGVPTPRELPVEPYSPPLQSSSESRAQAQCTESGGLSSLEENERAHILEALRQTGGRVSGPRGAAALLGIPRSTLQHKLHKLGITP